MTIPLSIDQALIIVIGAFAFRSFLKFDKAADKVEAAAIKLEKIEEKLEILESLKIRISSVEEDIKRIDAK